MKLNATFVLIIVALGFLWFKSHDARVRSDAIAKVRADSLNTALAVKDRLIGELAHRDTLLLESQVRHRADIEALRKSLRTIRASNRNYSRRLDSALTVLPDTSVFVVGITRLREEARTCGLALSKCDSLNVVLLGRLTLKDSVIGELQPALDRTREMWKQAEKRSRPGIFKTMERALPYLGMAFVLGWVVGN